MKSAAHVCFRTLVECVKQRENEIPESAKITREKYLNEDLLGCKSDAGGAIQLHQELNDVLAQCGPSHAKWSINDPTFNSTIHGGNDSLIEIAEMNINAVQSTIWNPLQDEFQHFLKNPPSNERRPNTQSFLIICDFSIPTISFHQLL